MPVLRTLIVLLATLLAGPVAGRAACAGRDLIATLPEGRRAALDAATAAQPYPSGNLWQATRSGRTVTLVGTLHLDDPRLDAVMERLAPAIAGAATLMTEAGPAEEEALRRYLALHPDAFTGPDLQADLSPDDRARLAAALRARGVPEAMGVHLHPWYLSALLDMPPCLAVAAAAEGGLDRRIVKRAAERYLPVTALEPWDVVLHVFDAFSRGEQIEMLRQALALDAQAEDMLATLVEAYFRQDSRRLWEFQRSLAAAVPGVDVEQVARDFATMERSLMAERNRAWIPAIEAASARGPVLAAFGALHLSGEAGVLNLLARRGWTLERLAF